MVKALIDCSFNIDQGECVAIVGTNGSGKTTLLHLLGGFERPSSGSIYINNTKMDTCSENQLALIRRKEIGYLFHNDSLLPELTIHENIMMPIILNRRTLDQSYYEDITNQLHISGILNRYPRQLSQNQLQCVSYARALIHQPSIIIADEPTGYLYDHISKEVIELLLNMVHLYQKTLIMVTQDPEVSIYADHIIKLNHGKIVEDRLTW
jgi:putative ABC transport system ATP-binding protein